MEHVKVDGMYRGVLLTADLTSTPSEAAWPDDDILAGDLSVTISGVDYGGSKSITKSAIAGQTGKHTIVIDLDGVSAGTMLELSGEYYIDSVRYFFTTEIYVDASPAIQAIAEADQRFVLDAGIYRLAVYEKGTSTEILARKNIKQLNGANMTDPATQILGGFQEPE
jgi:hypothetical protein